MYVFFFLSMSVFAHALDSPNYENDEYEIETLNSFIHDAMDVGDTTLYVLMQNQKTLHEYNE